MHVPWLASEWRRRLQFFNLSLLTSDFYAAAVRVLFFQGFDATSALAFAVAAVAVIAGLLIFFTAPSLSSPGATAPAPSSQEAARAGTLQAGEGLLAPEGHSAAAAGRPAGDAAHLETAPLLHPGPVPVIARSTACQAGAEVGCGYESTTAQELAGNAGEARPPAPEARGRQRADASAGLGGRCLATPLEDLRSG